MPLGNLTSQFFANVYLNDLDWFVKTKLKARYYIRYVDDFVIFERDKKQLDFCKDEINIFLKNKLNVQLHPDKSKIIELKAGANLLGYRVFYYYKLLRKTNKRKFCRKFNQKLELYKSGSISYEDFLQSLQGWLGYAIWANTYKMRKKIIEKIHTI